MFLRIQTDIFRLGKVWENFKYYSQRKFLIALAFIRLIVRNLHQGVPTPVLY